MPKLMKPVIVIILAVGVAAGAAVFLSRGADKPEENTSTTTTPSHVDIKGGHLRGPENAQLTLVEFGDYECPACGAAHPFVKEILNRYPDKVRLEFHHYPLVAVHPNAMAGAMAAEAAGEQGKFWEMHDALFEHQREWGESSNPEQMFIRLASQLGLDVNRFMQSLRSPALQTRILQDVTLGENVKVQATPTFYINGQEVRLKLSMDDFAQAIESRLKK
jgi:NhaA family Na+:H+ antiporter